MKEEAFVVFPIITEVLQDSLISAFADVIIIPATYTDIKIASRNL